MNSAYERIILPWSGTGGFKEQVDNKNPHHQNIESANGYSIWFDEGFTRYYCVIPKDSGADQTEYEATYKADANWAVPQRPYAFATGDFEFHGSSTAATAVTTIPKGTTVDIDFAIAQNYYLDGGELVTQDHAFGDYVVAQVVDKDNLLGYGAGFVLKQWVDSWGICPNGCTEIKTAYAGIVPAGMYLRIKYTSVGATNDPKAFVNYRLHKAI